MIFQRSFSLYRVFNIAIVLRRFDLVWTHYKSYEIEKKNVDPQINMYDIVLVLVMFGEIVIIVFSTLKWYYLVRNSQFSGKNKWQNGKIRKFKISYGYLKFFFENYIFANTKNCFPAH